MIAVMKITHWLTGSQGSVARTGVMWSRRQAPESRVQFPFYSADSKRLEPRRRRLEESCSSPDDSRRRMKAWTIERVSFDRRMSGPQPKIMLDPSAQHSSHLHHNALFSTRWQSSQGNEMLAQDDKEKAAAFQDFFHLSVQLKQMMHMKHYQGLTKILGYITILFLPKRISILD